MSEFNKGLAACGVQIRHHMPDGDGVYAKEARLPPGGFFETHRHTFTHKSILASGKAAVRTESDGGAIHNVLVGPTVLTLRAGVAHEVVAITECVWFCIHATDECDPGKIDHLLVSK